MHKVLTIYNKYLLYATSTYYILGKKNCLFLVEFGFLLEELWQENIALLEHKQNPFLWMLN